MTVELHPDVHGNFSQNTILKGGYVAILVASAQLHERCEVEDNTLRWLGGLISKNADNKPPWMAKYATFIPKGCVVEYLWPTADGNLTAYNQEKDGTIAAVSGAWVWQALAHDFKGLNGCLEALFRGAMRINSVDEDAFKQEGADSKILNRTNNAYNKTWETKYSVALAPRGWLDPDFQRFILELLQRHSFLKFDGSLAACDDAAFREKHLCRYNTREDVVAALVSREQAVIDLYHGNKPSAAVVDRSSEIDNTHPGGQRGGSHLQATASAAQQQSPGVSAQREEAASEKCNLAEELWKGRVKLLNDLVQRTQARYAPGAQGRKRFSRRVSIGSMQAGSRINFTQRIANRVSNLLWFCRPG